MLWAVCLVLPMAARQFPEEVKLLKEYKIPRAAAVKFGDVDGDGKGDFLVLTPGFSAHLFNHAGTSLWSYEAPAEGTAERRQFEPPGSIWDLDGDGLAEVIHWRLLDGKEWLVVADGKTGAIRNKVEWPTTPLPHVYNNFRIAIAKLKPGRANNIVVFTDSGGTISVHAYASDLKLLWKHTETRKKDHMGHYIYPVDLNGDGIDEVVAGPMVFDAAGRMLWNRFFTDNHDHPDSFRFADINGDGRPEIISSFSDIGVVAFDALSGGILWQNMAAHAQQIETGAFLKGVPAPQIVVGARYYGDRKRGEPYLSGQLHWFDKNGNLLMKWPDKALPGNPDFAKGDWRGDGTTALFWFNFRIGADGKGTPYFAEPVYHMFDFTGQGADEVITLQGETLRVYGCRVAIHKKMAPRDSEYLRNKVANHTHY